MKPPYEQGEPRNKVLNCETTQHAFVRVLYEKPSGEEVQFEFEIQQQPDAKVDWIAQELIRQLRERAVSC